MPSSRLLAILVTAVVGAAGGYALQGITKPAAVEATPPAISFSIDAAPGGAIDATRTVPVGVNFSIDVVLDTPPVPYPLWHKYYVDVEYDDVLLDPTGFPASWQFAPVIDTTGGNLFPFAGGASCTPPPGVLFEDDLDLAEVSVNCGPVNNGAATGFGGGLLQLVFTCEAPGFARIGFDFENTYVVDSSLNTLSSQDDHIHEAIINCGSVPGTATPAPTWTPRPTWTPTATPTSTPTLSPTSFSVDAVPGGSLDAARSVNVGETFSVDVVLDWEPQTIADEYAIVIDYGDVVLDAVGHAENLYPYPPPICIYTSVPSFPSCLSNCLTGGPTAEDDMDTASWKIHCDYLIGAHNFIVFESGPLARFTFACEAAGSSAITIRGLNETFLRGIFGQQYNDEQYGATITCVDTSTPTPTHTPTPPDTPTALPVTGTPPAIEKSPEGNENNTGDAGTLPLANLFLCDDTDGDGPVCSGPNEGELVFVEHAFSPSPLGAFEFQIKFDHKIFDIDLECVTAQDPGPACTGDADEDNVLNTDADTWDIQLSQQLKGDALREWGMDKCFRNVTENYINFACVSTGPEGAGLSGDIDLAEVTLHPDADLKFRLRPGNDNGVVRVILDENCELVDTLGHPVEGSIAGGLAAVCGDLAVTVRILEGDMDLDCDVDLADAQAIAQRYGMVLGLFLYDPWYDLEPNIADFDIDAKDVQKVFGRIGSTCQDPVPPQPPIAPPQS